MKVKVATVGKGKRWHIVDSFLVTYCGGDPDWISDNEMENEMEVEKINYLCGNCSGNGKWIYTFSQKTGGRSRVSGKG